MTQTIRAIQLNDPVEGFLRGNFTTLIPGQTVAEALQSLRRNWQVVDEKKRLIGVCIASRKKTIPIWRSEWPFDGFDKSRHYQTARTARPR